MFDNCVDLSEDDLYIHFLDNHQTSDHQSLIYGLRELNATELSTVCSNASFNGPPITNQPGNFTSNYRTRVFTSGCYYLDQNNQWQSNGLTVSSDDMCLLLKRIFHVV